MGAARLVTGVDRRPRAPRAPLCTVADACGGCPLIDQPAATQETVKLARLRAALTSAGLGVHFIPTRLHRAGLSTGYRNRLRLRINESGHPVFFNSEKSPECAVVDPGVLKWIAILQRGSDEAVGLFRNVLHIEIRKPDLEGKAGLCLYTSSDVDAQTVYARIQSHVEKHWPDLLVAVVPWSQRNRANVRLAWPRPLPRQRYALLDHRFALVPLTSFVQVNERANHALCAALVRGATARGCRQFVDLFCGCGNHALALAAAGLCGIGIEQDADAICAATDAARVQGLDSVAFRSGDARVEIARHKEQPDVVVCNPPRAGLKEAVEHFHLAHRQGRPRWLTKWLALISCNPESLARDLSKLQQKGFRIEEMAAFDMFPHTQHVETLTWLSGLHHK